MARASFITFTQYVGNSLPSSSIKWDQTAHIEFSDECSLNISCFHCDLYKQANTPKWIFCHNCLYCKRDICYFSRVLEFRHRAYMFMFIGVVRSALVIWCFLFTEQFLLSTVQLHKKAKTNPLVLREMRTVATRIPSVLLLMWWLILSTGQARII